MFVDIEGFTRLSESLAPAQVIELLNKFFGAAAGIVDKHGGVVVNYIGDGFIASFNAPLPIENYAVRAVKRPVNCYLSFRPVTLKAIDFAYELVSRRDRLQPALSAVPSAKPTRFMATQ